MRLQTEFRLRWSWFCGEHTWRSAWDELVQLYSEPHRRYHTMAHIQHCMRLFKDSAELFRDPMGSALALFYHDAIYVPTRAGRPVSDNEERSAELCAKRLRAAGVTQAVIDPICKRIMATTHQRDRPIGGDALRIVDIDLAILSESWPVYQRYIKGIEFEYRYDGSISEKAYCQGRTEFIQQMLDRLMRDTIYNRHPFTQRHNEAARDNMKREANSLLARLSSLQ